MERILLEFSLRGVGEGKGGREGEREGERERGREGREEKEERKVGRREGKNRKRNRYILSLFMVLPTATYQLFDFFFTEVCYFRDNI